MGGGGKIFLNGKDIENFLHNSQVSNCVLEAPNGIATYSGTTLTLKQGLKLLIPKGRKADGTLNNEEYTLTQDVSFTYNWGNFTRYFGLAFTSQGVASVGYGVYWKGYSNAPPTIDSTKFERYFNTVENKYYSHEANIGEWVEDNNFAVVVGVFTATNDNISSVKVFGALSLPTKFMVESYINQFSLIPSKRYISLSLTANTTLNYKAPANGYIVVDMPATSASQRLFIFNDARRLRTSIYSSTSNEYLNAFLPVNKGDTCNIYAQAAPRWAYFIYAEGTDDLL